MTTAVGTPSDGNISRAIVNKNISKIRANLLDLEDLYYSFRDDTERTIQAIKYELDKLIKLVGDGNDDN